MAQINSSATFRETLKRTLNRVVTDKDVSINNTVWSKFFKRDKMQDAYEEYQEYGGIGLADYQTEGSSITIGGVSEGTKWTFYARKFGRKMVVTDEAIEDCKYKEAIAGRKRCLRAIVKASEHEAALVLARGWNTEYTYGDGQPLFSLSHPLAVGNGTESFSNTFAVPMAPSVAAVDQARIMAKKMPSYDGLRDRLRIKQVVCPVEQESEWERVLYSKLDTDDPGNHNAINIANRSVKPELIVNEYWDNTTTNSMFTTDAELGLMFLFRRPIKSRSWVGNDEETVNFACTVRWSLGTANPRHTIGNQF